MITHKLIQRETEELKQAFKKEEIVIPSFWACCWPGLVYGSFIFLYYLISMHGNFEFIPLFAGYVFLIFMGISGTRSTYLCFPHAFLKKSKFFSFLKNKMKIYVYIHLLLIIFGGIFIYFYYPANSNHFTRFDAGLYLFAILFLSMFIPIAIFSIDISRYQLSAFVAIIEQFKEQHKKESA